MNPRLGLLLFLSVASIPAWAQQRPTLPALPGPGPRPASPTQLPQPPIPTAIPAGPTQAGQPGGDTDQVRLQLPNTDIQVILSLYEQLTGKRIVTDNTVVGTISINILKPVSKEDAVRIIETSLFLNGFALTPAEGNMIKLVGAGKNPRAFGVNIYSVVTQIPDNVGVASVMFELEYADSKDMKTLIDQFLVQSPYTSSVPLPGAIIVTESTIMLRNLARIIAKADVPPAEVESRFYPLERASAKEVVDKMNKLFEKSTQQSAGGGTPTTAPGRPIIQPNGQPAPAGAVEMPASITGLSVDSIIVGKIKVDYDERTNRIHIVTRPVNLPFIEDLIKEFDSDLKFGEPVKRPLKYVSASDVLDVVVKSITEPGEKTEGDTGGTTSTSTHSQTEPTNSSTQNGGFGNNSSGLGGSNSGGGLSISEGLETPEKDLTPKAVILGTTKIIADPRENTIIVLGNDEVKQKIFTLLDQLDVRAPQVMLNTVIGEFTLNNDSNFGVDYLLHAPAGPLSNILSSVGASGSTPATTSFGSFLYGKSGAAVTNLGGSPVAGSLASAVGAGNGFTAAIGAANSLDIIVNALESTGRFHVTNRPMVFANNNKKAVIVSGQQIPVPTSTLSNLTSTGVVGSTAAVQSSIDYVQVALQLEVVPLINSDREVSLDILQKLDSPGALTNVGGSNVPAINTRYIRTNVSVANKSTIVLGGLITKTQGGNSSAIPLLGRIPVLGYLFGAKTKQSDRSELVILIRPVVTVNPDEMADESHVERKRLLMEPDVESTIAAPTPHPTHSVNFRYQADKATLQ